MANEQTNNSSSSLNNNNSFSIARRISRMNFGNEDMSTKHINGDTCFICLDNILEAGKKFGFQNNCDHTFCFDCLTTWRRGGGVVDRDACYRCPLCRVRSTFIAPSPRPFIDAEDKQKILEEHRKHLKTIPCSNIRRNGFCRFGNRCYYKHNISLNSLLNPARGAPLQNPPRPSNVYRMNTQFIYEYDPPLIFRRNNEQQPPEDEADDEEEQQVPSSRIICNLNRYRPY